LTQRGTPTAASFTITGLTANTAYYIAVSARNNAGEGAQSNPITANTAPSLPAAPSGLAAGVITENSIAVSWNSISGVSGYTVYAGTSSGNLTQRGTPATASFTITGLTANTAYYIAVSAKNSAGEGAQSSPITATTANTATKLPAPTGLVVVQVSTSSIQVSWNAVSGAASYKIYRSSSAAGTYASIGTTPGTSYNDTGLTASTDYYYKISTLTNGNAEGDLSDYVLGRISAQTKAITSFRFADFSVNGTINGTNISVRVPNIVNLTMLTPTIVHNGKSISPASGVAQDFTNPIQYTVTAEDNTIQSYIVTVTVTNTGLAAAFTWINNNAGSNRTYTIVAKANESIAPVTIDPWYSNVNIILSGGTAEKIIGLISNGSLFTVSYGTLTLENNITLQGSSSNDASLVRLNSYGTLVMKTGSKIQNNTVTINNDDAFGGGVYVDSGETFTMNGGTISDNTAESSSVLSTSYTYGGGVAAWDSSTLAMKGGTISGNIVKSADNRLGGGVYIRSDKFTKTGGTIYGSNASPTTLQNTAKDTNSGHAVYALVGSTTLKRNYTAGTTVNMDSSRVGSAGGWE